MTRQIVKESTYISSCLLDRVYIQYELLRKLNIENKLNGVCFSNYDVVLFQFVCA